MIYWHLHYRQKHSFGNILRKFDGNGTFVMDSVSLLSSTLEIGIFHPVFQMFHMDKIVSFVTLISFVKIL